MDEKSLDSRVEVPTIDFLSKIDDLQLLVTAMFRGNAREQYEATVRFRKELSRENNPPIEDVIRAGVIPRLVVFLQREDKPDLQFEAAWALTNVASGSSEQTKVLVDSGATAIFVDLLSSPSLDLKEQAVWALGNIAGDSFGFRDHIIGLNCIPLLAELATSDANVKIHRNVAWAVSNLCRGKPAPNFDLVSPALPALAHLLHHTDEEILSDTCWAFSYLCDGENSKIGKVLESGACKRLVELVGHQSDKIVQPALRSLGNIVSGDEAQTQAALDCGALARLSSLLSREHAKPGILKEAVWAVSNIGSGTQDQIQLILDADILPAVIHLLGTASDDVRKEAAWVFSNLASEGSMDQAGALVEMGCIEPLCRNLERSEGIAEVAISALENILKAGEAARDADPGSVNPFVSRVVAGGGREIEALKKHSSVEVSATAGRILLLFPEADAEPTEDKPDAELAEEMVIE